MKLSQIPDYFNMYMVLSLIVAALIARIAIPPVVRVARAKHLVARTNRRTAHEGSVPYMGGIAIFASMLISSSLFMIEGSSREFQYVIPAVMIIFFIGLKDDLANISPWTKFGGQILASSIVIIMADVRIYSLHGILGINDIHPLLSLALSLIVFLGIINAFNLIDGIDGLASGLGIQISFIFGVWLAFMKLDNYAVFAFALTGAMVPFYIYNVFGKKNKLFLGDTGSLLIGMVFSILAVKIISSHMPANSRLYFSATPMVVMSAMIIPIADMIRVFSFRIARRRSPFSPDKHHFHHYLLQMGMTHWQASTTICAINFLIFLLAFAFRNRGNLELGILVLTLGIGITALPRIARGIRPQKITRA